MKKKTNKLVKLKQVKAAVKALKEFHTKKAEENPSLKKPLFEDANQAPIHLTFTLKRIPELSSIQMIKVPLPHTLVTDVSEVCLITGDLDKTDRKADIEPTVQHYKELLSKYGVNVVSEVIPLRQLRTEYKQFEAKRKLHNAYDFFLCDSKITQCLPKVLGKFFFKKRKFPQQIDLGTSNLKNQIENALSRTVFYLTGRGGTCSAEVAHLGFSTRQIVENIEAAVNTLSASIPGAQGNINGFYIKIPGCVTIPLYMSLESGNDVELPVPATVEDVEAEEITTLSGRKVKVFADGNIEVLPADENNSSAGESDDDDYAETPPKKMKVGKDTDTVGSKVRNKKKREVAVSDRKTERVKKRKGKDHEGNSSVSEAVRDSEIEMVKKRKGKDYEGNSSLSDSEVIFSGNIKDVDIVKSKARNKKKQNEAVSNGETKRVVKRRKRKVHEGNYSVGEAEVIFGESIKDMDIVESKARNKKKQKEAVGDGETETAVKKRKGKDREGKSSVSEADVIFGKNIKDMDTVGSKARNKKKQNEAVTDGKTRTVVKRRKRKVHEGNYSVGEAEVIFGENRVLKTDNAELKNVSKRMKKLNKDVVGQMKILSKKTKKLKVPK